MLEAQDEPTAAPTIPFAGKTLTIAEAQGIVRNSGTWFWWIAGLSLVNSVANLLNLQFAMIIGLGITQLFDGFLHVAKENQADLMIPIVVVRGVHLALVLSAAAFFFLIGMWARTGSWLAFGVGIFAYVLDAGIFLLVGDWLGLGFHAFVLFGLWNGLVLSRALSAQALAAEDASGVVVARQP